MKERPWFDSNTGKRKGVTISMSLTDDADFEKGMKRLEYLLKPTKDNETPTQHTLTKDNVPKSNETVNE